MPKDHSYIFFHSGMYRDCDCPDHGQLFLTHHMQLPDVQFMVYMLFDNPADKQNMTFLNGYETAKIRQIYPPQKCNSTKEMLAACKDVIKGRVGEGK